MKFILSCLFFLLCANQTLAQSYPDHTSLYVNDFADLLDPETETRLDDVLRAAKTERDLEATLVTINRQSDYGFDGDFKSFATGLFNHWGIGDADRNDGILILVSKDDRKMRIILGDGYSPVFDDRAKTVIEDYFAPYFKRGEYAKGIEAGVLETLKRLQIDPNGNQTSTSISETTKPRKSRFWAWFIGILGLGGSGAATYGVWHWMRYRPRRCDLCQRKMQRLSETEDDAYLSQGQQVEEAIKSKDYDVWYCAYDDHTMIEAYQSWTRKHTACPKCQFRTYHSVRTVLTSATTSRDGSARIDYNCRHCDHNDTEIVTIPQISESSSSSSSSSSFGGGSSSGGGAGGSW